MQTYIEIFKSGQHTDANGKTLTFTEADLRQAAEVYHPDRHEAPLVIGHPKDNAPAYGWVKSLLYRGGKLLAVPNQVAPGFAQNVKDGRFKKVSSSFYLQDSPSNPVPGSLYLRHVGFLGSMAPAVKGLQNPQLTMFAASAGAETIEFSMPVVIGQGDRQPEDGARAAELDRREAELLIRMARFVEYCPPSGFRVDPGQLELHRLAIAYQEMYPTTEYPAAFQFVLSNPYLKGGDK